MDPERAEIGTKYAIILDTDGQKLPLSAIRTYEVSAKGEGCTAGLWHCTTHGQVFRHDLGKDIHVSAKRKVCKLAWLCLEHGKAEVP